MTLPSRADFLANRLLPVSNLDPDFECPISLESTSDAVELPCKHIFDRETIISSLSARRRGNNVCPMCRAELFVPPEQELLKMPSPDRRQLVLQALRRAGLAFDEMNAEVRYHLFGFAPAQAELQRGIPSAQQYLVQNTNPAVFTGRGTALIELSHLRGRIVAMGNLIPSLAALTGREYTNQQPRHYFTIINSLANNLQMRDGEEVDSTHLPQELRQSLIDDAQRTVGDADFFAEAGSDLTQDLDTLISYVTHCCVLDFQERAAIQRRRAKAEFMAAKERSRAMDCSSSRECTIM